MQPSHLGRHAWRRVSRVYGQSGLPGGWNHAVYHQPKMQCNNSPAAKDCTELVIFGEIRANSVATTVLEISTNIISVSQSWLNWMCSLCPQILCIGVLEGSSGSLVANIRRIYHRGQWWTWTAEGDGSSNSGDRWLVGGWCPLVLQTA